jgi:DNA-directed RNA polymerase subunit alpha
MYLTIGRGRGYSPAEDNKTEDQAIGVIPIDSIFSPIRRAAYNVDSARVGQRTDFDKLTLEVETDGSIEPGSALREAAEILIKTMAIFTDPDRVDELTSREALGEVEEALAAVAPSEGDDRLIEELEIGVRAYNCLKRAGIQTVGDLVQRSESELNAIPNFGKRSTEEVKESLHALGLSLREE